MNKQEFLNVGPNQYRCSHCSKLALPLEHEVIQVPGPLTTKRSDWGPGIPTTMRKCTCCGFEDGPWVSAEEVGGGW